MQRRTSRRTRARSVMLHGPAKSEGPGRFLGKNPGPSTCRRTRSARLHRLYACDARRCPVRWGTCILAEPSHRLYNCRGCGEQVHICRHCDRGNIYCSGACAARRRRESLLRAGQRYQLSPHGACRHAARQRAWRERHAKKVTHQGSPEALSCATVNAASMDSRGELTDGDALYLRRWPHHRTPVAPRCSFCGRVLSPFMRLGPLRGGP